MNINALKNDGEISCCVCHAHMRSSTNMHAHTKGLITLWLCYFQRFSKAYREVKATT